MNYAIQCTIGESEKLLLLASEHDGRFYNVKEILSSKSLTNDAYLTSSDDVDFPYLTCYEDSIYKGSVKMLSQLYEIFRRGEFNISDDLLEKIEGQINNLFTIEQLKQLISCSKELTSYIKGDKVKINMSSSWYLNRIRTKELVSEVNNSGKAKEVYIEGENKTLFSKSPADEVFIRVPSYEQLMLDGYLLPSFKDIIDPYETQQFYTPGFKNYISDRFPVELITGNSENNDLPIQSNERRFYNALKSLMDSGISKEFPDKTIEECIESNIGSTTVRDFILNIVLMGAYQNWRHNGLVPINVEKLLSEDPSSYSDDDDDENNSFDTGKDEGNWDFYTDSLAKIGFFDGATFLKNIISEVFNEDVYGIIDIAIKFLRFGSRKPSRIPLGKKGYLDLNSFRIVSGSGNYNSTEILFDEEGNCLEVIGSVHMKDYMTDENYKKRNSIKIGNVDMPVGLVCKKSFKNTTEHHTIAISFIDLIKAYESDEKLCKVKGISYANGELLFSKEVAETLEAKITLRDLISQISENSSMSTQYYQYSGFIDAFMSQSCFDKRLSVLSIWSKYYSSRDLSPLSLYTYDTEEELKDLCEQYTTPPRACIEANIARYIIPILCRVSEIYENSILKGKNMTGYDVAYCFNESMKQLGFIGTFGDSKSLDSKTKMETLNSFSQKTNKEENGDEDMSISFLDNNLDGMKFCRIYLRKDIFIEVKKKFDTIAQIETLFVKDKFSSDPNAKIECVVIGYLAMKPDSSKFVFLNPDTNVTEVSGNMDVLKLSTILSSIMKKLSISSESKYRYYDSNSCSYYCTIIDNIIQILGDFFLRNSGK